MKLLCYLPYQDQSKVQYAVCKSLDLVCAGITWSTCATQIKYDDTIHFDQAHLFV